MVEQNQNNKTQNNQPVPVAAKYREQSTALDIDLSHVTTGLSKIKAFQSLVRKQLVRDHDFGTIPGTPKPTLWKPGAEKLCKLLGLSDSYRLDDKLENWDSGLFMYRITCELRSISTGDLIAQGLGSCNSRESRYRYRWVFGSEVPEHIDKKSLAIKTIITRKGNKAIMYRIENEDPYSLPNTLLKMAKKRAMIDATLSAGRLSDIFSQGDGLPVDENGDLPLKDRREQMIAYFQGKGISQQQVFDLISVTKLKQVTSQQLAQLKQIAEDVKDGVASIEDFFGIQEQEPESARGENQASGPEQEQPSETTIDLETEKANLIDEISSALSKLHLGDTIESQAAKLKTLKYIFGKTQLDEIVKLPTQILEAGLQAIKSQAGAAETSGDGIPI